MLIKFIIFSFFLFSISLSQVILYPDSTYTFNELKICINENQFNKIDSIIGDTLKYQNTIYLLEKKISVQDSIEYHLRTKINILETRENICNQNNQIKWYHWLTSSILAITTLIISLN